MESIKNDNNSWLKQAENQVNWKLKLHKTAILCQNRCRQQKKRFIVRNCFESKLTVIFCNLHDFVTQFKNCHTFWARCSWMAIIYTEYRKDKKSGKSPEYDIFGVRPDELSAKPDDFCWITFNRYKWILINLILVFNVLNKCLVLILGYKSVLIASSLGFISIQTKLVHLVAELSLQKWIFANWIVRLSEKKGQDTPLHLAGPCIQNKLKNWLCHQNVESVIYFVRNSNFGLRLQFVFQLSYVSDTDCWSTCIMPYSINNSMNMPQCDKGSYCHIWPCIAVYLMQQSFAVESWDTPEIGFSDKTLHKRL